MKQSQTVNITDSLTDDGTVVKLSDAEELTEETVYLEEIRVGHESDTADFAVAVVPQEKIPDITEVFDLEDDTDLTSFSVDVGPVGSDFAYGSLQDDGTKDKYIDLSNEDLLIQQSSDEENPSIVNAVIRVAP